MWELAKHPEIQERLRKEVAPYQDQELSVDDIGNLKYLDAVCTETCVLHTYTGLLII
jgi:cytochrome P450